MIRKVIGIAAVLVVAQAGVAAAATKTFSSGNISKGVPGSQVVTHTINVKKSGKIKDLNVGMAFTTNSVEQFSFMLQSPKGKVVHLSSANGGDGNGFGPNCSSLSTFDDEADTDIEDFEGVDQTFIGPYIPEQWDDITEQGGLDTLDGKQLKGKWRLIVLNGETIGVGSLNCFKLEAKF